MTQRAIRYGAPPPSERVPAYLVGSRGTSDEHWYPFFDTLEIGRDTPGSPPPRPGVLLVADPTVSRSHCVVVYRQDGRCLLRDTSRNGTRVNGRRLVPNVALELNPGDRLALGEDQEFIVVFERTSQETRPEGTLAVPASAMVTVLVGDIRDYTVLVQRVASHVLQPAVARVFRILTDAISRHGGTVKEFQGDAIVAFWEGDFVGLQAAAACRAALGVDAIARQMAGDPSIWNVDHFPLRLDWALATGPVTIDSFGGDHPAGLSMVGEAPVLAFRLEEFANDETGRILACKATRDRASRQFQFRGLGPMTAKGFEVAQEVFSLVDELQPEADRGPDGVLK